MEIQMKLAKWVKGHQLEYGPKPTFARIVRDVVVEEKSSVAMIDKGWATEEQCNEDDQGKTMPDGC